MLSKSEGRAVLSPCPESGRATWFAHVRSRTFFQKPDIFSTDPTPFFQGSYTVVATAITHKLILPGFILVSALRNEESTPPFSLDAFSRDMSRAAALPLVAPDIPRRIFMIWKQGLGRAPELVRISHASWLRANPGWEIVMLDDTTLADWVDMSDIHPSLPIVTQADAIRLRLLSQHGGVWADSTTLCLRPLDDWLGRHLATGFFAFAPASRTRPVASWFMAGRPGAPVLEIWRKTFDSYIRGRSRRGGYYCLHHTFDYLLRTDRRFRAAWAATPQLSADGPHMLKWLLRTNAADLVPPSPQALAEVPFFKLNWRGGPEAPDLAVAKLAEFGIPAPVDVRPAALEA